MATLTAQAIVGAGLVPSTGTACAASGDIFLGNEKEFIYVKNGSASSRVVTVAAQKKCDFGDSHDMEVTITASTSVMIGTFGMKWFNSSSDYIHITYSNNSDMTIGVFQL